MFNRILYGGFLLMSIYFLATTDISSAMSNLAIGLIFDPFNQKIAWENRSLYQRAWLLIHVSLVLFLLAFIIFNRFA